MTDVHGPPFSSRKKTVSQRKNIPSPMGDFSAFDRLYYTTDGYDDYLERFAAMAREDIVPALLAATGAQKEETFLDVGCGMGGVVLALRERGYDAFGAEVSPFCLAESPARAWMQFGDIRALPFADQSFDIISCIDMFQYLSREQMAQAAGELVRVARRFILFESMDASSPENVSQELNPDVLRKSDCAAMRGEDFIALFTRCGCTVAKTGILSEDFDFNCLFAVGRSGDASRQASVPPPSA